jgi:DNA-binding beta-propeller fold protein YncE
MLVRVAEVCLFAALILFTTACLDECQTQQGLGVQKWEGKIYRFWYKKGELLSTITVLTPKGEIVGGSDPRLPFQVFPKDGSVEIVPRAGGGGAAAGASFSPRAAGVPAGAPPYYVYLLSDAPQTAVYILNQQTGAVAATVPLPTLPQGIAVNHLGDRAYVTNHGIEAGNPFFPQAPPRVRVIDKATRAVSGTIDLSNGMALGKPVVSPDDRFVYVPYAADRRHVPSATSGVAIIDAQTRAVVATVPLSVVDWQVRRAAITPDGALLFVVGQTFPARVFVIDTLTREQSATFIVAGSSIRDLLVDHTGSRLYLLNETSLVVYDTATLTEAGRLTVRENGQFNNMALSLDGGSLFLNDEFSASMVRVETATLRVAEDLSFPGSTTAPDSSLLFIVP